MLGSWSGKDVLIQQHNDIGGLRVAAVVSEWTASTMLMLFVSTLTSEFKKLGYKSPEIFFLEQRIFPDHGVLMSNPINQENTVPKSDAQAQEDDSVIT